MSFDFSQTGIELPSGWRLRRIKDVAGINELTIKKKNEPASIHYIDISSVSSGSMEAPKQMRYKDAPSRAKRILRDKDILVSCVRPNLRQHILLEEVEEDWIASTGFCVLSAHDPEACWYLYEFVTSDLFNEHLVRVADGAAYPAFKPVDIEEAIIPWPDDESLHRISSFAKALGNKIELNCQINATLEEMAQTLFKRWFVDFEFPYDFATNRPAPNGQPYKSSGGKMGDSELGEIPEGWKPAMFKDLCVHVQSGGTPKRSEASYWGGDIKWLSSGEVRGVIALDTKEKITKTGLHKSSAKLWPKYSTVVAMYGATAGQVCLLADEMTANQACCALIPRVNCICYTFVAARKSITHLAGKASGSAQQNLNKSLVENNEAIVPHVDVLKMYEQACLPFLNEWIGNEMENKTLAKLRDTLLPKLLSGELDVTGIESPEVAHG